MVVIHSPVLTEAFTSKTFVMTVACFCFCFGLWSVNCWITLLPSNTTLAEIGQFTKIESFGGQQKFFQNDISIKKFWEHNDWNIFVGIVEVWYNFFLSQLRRVYFLKTILINTFAIFHLTCKYLVQFAVTCPIRRWV